MINSNNFENYIAAYIDGDLSNEEKNEFEKLIQSDETSKIKFEQTKELLNDLSSMSTLKTSSNFLSELHKKIELKENSKNSFIDKFNEYFIEVKPAFSFAMSFGVLAIFTFVYLNDLKIFNRQEMISDNDSEMILKNQNIDIKLASGERANDSIIEEDIMFSEDSENDSLDDSFKNNKVKFNFKAVKETIKNVIEEIKVNRAFTKEDE